MEIQKFINQIDIQFVEGSNCFGHYPFHLWATKKETESMNIESLMLGGDVIGCYQRFKSNISAGFDQIFMSVDFPASADMEYDFVAVFSYDNGQIKLQAIPYKSDGERVPALEKSELLSRIEDQFKNFVL